MNEKIELVNKPHLILWRKWRESGGFIDIETGQFIQLSDKEHFIWELHREVTRNFAP